MEISINLNFLYPLLKFSSYLFFMFKCHLKMSLLVEQYSFMLIKCNSADLGNRYLYEQTAAELRMKGKRHISMFLGSLP